MLLLADNAGRVLSGSSLREHIGEPCFDDCAGNLAAHIDRLRRRMRQHLGADCIRTVRGLGHTLEAPQG